MNVNLPRATLAALLLLCAQNLARAQTPYQLGAISSSTTVTRSERIEASQPVGGTSSTITVTVTSAQSITMKPGFSVRNANFVARIGSASGRMNNEIVAVEEEKETTVKIYPNPFTDQTTVEFESLKGTPASVVVYDLAGREVKRIGVQDSKKGVSSKVNIDARTLPSGLYILKTTSGDKIESSKLLKN